jgi:WD40 repeat protein
VIDNQIYDLAWCGRNQVFACGNGAVYECEVDNNIRLTKTHTSQQADTEWTFLRCAHTANYSVAVTASATKASIWIPTHDILIENAHQDAITAIDIQPQSALQTKQRNNSITIASYSADSTVGVWQVDLDSKQYNPVHRLRLGASIPALTGSFSPDGYALGAVSKDQVFIWNVERGGDPMATWKTPSGAQVKEEPDRVTNGLNGHGPANPDRALSWDPDGKKLACGLGNQVC